MVRSAYNLFHPSFPNPEVELLQHCKQKDWRRSCGRRKDVRTLRTPVRHEFLDLSLEQFLNSVELLTTSGKLHKDYTVYEDVKSILPIYIHVYPVRPCCDDLCEIIPSI